MTNERDHPFAPRNPHRLYRDPRNGMVSGVCAGLADYLGIPAFPVRLITVLAALFGLFLPVLGGYVLLAALLKPRPERVYGGPEDEAFWRSVAMKPDRTVAGLHQKFRDLEQRLAAIEGCVTSQEFQLSRAIHDLER